MGLVHSKGSQLVVQGQPTGQRQQAGQGPPAAGRAGGAGQAQLAGQGKLAVLEPLDSKTSLASFSDRPTIREPGQVDPGTAFRAAWRLQVGPGTPF